METKRMLSTWGKNMLNITATAIFYLSGSVVAIGATFLAVVGFAKGVFSINVVALFLLLLQASLISLLVVLVIAALIKSVSFGLGHFLIWVSKDRSPEKAKIEFDVLSDDGKTFLLLVKNKEQRIGAKNVKITWLDPRVVSDYPNEPVVKHRSWVVERKALEWKGLGTGKTDTIDIPKNEMKAAYLFEIYGDRDIFCLQALNSEPIIFSPIEDCVLCLAFQAKVGRKVTPSRIYIDLGKRHNRLVVNSVTST